MSLEAVTASAPGKVILVGEHFVVLGKPALVMAIDRRAYVTALKLPGDQVSVESEQIPDLSPSQVEPIVKAAKMAEAFSGKTVGLRIVVRSEIPPSAGLGSSAAVAAATAAAVGKLLGSPLPREEVFRVSLEAERSVHGTPSGVDPAISTYGGIMLFQRGEPLVKLSAASEVPLVVGNTKVERTTGDLVARVRALNERYPRLTSLISEAASLLAAETREAIEKGDLQRVGEMMNVAHGLLSSVGVSHPSLERLIYAARNAGALGAKLTGAGGGGCMIALAYPNRLDAVAAAIQASGGFPLRTRLSSEGVVA
ncbi:MAG: mevalonate kinase [Candidatus Bathyarchaeia archaeon]